MASNPLLYASRFSSLRDLPKPCAFTGFLFPRVCAGETPALPGGPCAGETPALPGGPFNRLHCLHRLIREGCQRNERCEKSLQCTRSAMEADGLFVHQQRSDASLIPGFHTNGKLCFWNESPTLTAYLGWTSPGSAGVPPASLFLQTTCHPRPLPCKVHRTRLYGVLFPRARVCAGETPALPGGLVRAGRPRSQVVFTPSPFATPWRVPLHSFPLPDPRPTGPSRASSNAVALRG